MNKASKFLAAAVLAFALTGTALAASDIHINPMPPHLKPNWTEVPNAAGVFWAPNLPTDVFRHGTKYYFFWEGYLYQGSKPSGPWKSVTKVPAWFSTIDPSYFKTTKKEEPTPPPGAPGAPSAPGVAAPTPGAAAPSAPPAEKPAPEQAPAAAPAAPSPATSPEAPAQPPVKPSGEVPKAM